MSPKFLYTIFLIAVLASTTHAQRFKNNVSGQIIDKTNNEPVYYVNIFLANTTLGSTSNAEGYYSIKNVPPGNYTLVISHIGYETITERVLITATSKQIHNFALKPTVLRMDTVQIDRDRDRTWREYFKIFEREFLGFSENAEACQFTNPEVLHLVKDENSGELYGKTIRPLELIHSNFGYRVRIIVRTFSVTNDQINYSVLPAFQEMTPESEEQADFWEKNRREAFYGSFRHFLYALFSHQFQEAGFSVEEVEDARRFRTSTEQHDSQSAVGDIFSHTDYGLIKRLHFTDYLRVRYQQNWAETSFLKLPFDTMEVDLAGNALSDFQIIRSGHWGETRFADELPLDYRPKQE